MIENHGSVTDSICKIAAGSTGQACKKEYFKILENDRNQGVSAFFTDDSSFVDF
jgi:hypothetical protein